MAGIIRIYGVEYAKTELSPDEERIFREQFDALIGFKGGVERRLLESRMDKILEGLKVIKKKLNDAPFRGVYPEDTEIGFSLIRPKYLGFTNWKVTLSVGWQDWLGTFTSPFTVPDDIGMIIVGFKSYSAEPKLSEIRVKMGRKEFIPYVVRHIKARDNDLGQAVYPIPTLYLFPKDTVAIRFASDFGGEDEIEPIGIAFGLGRYLKSE